MTSHSTLIHTERLILREINVGDLENVFHGLSNDDVTKYYAVSFNSLEETQTQMEWYKNLKRDKTGIWWAICSRENQTFYGAIGYNELDEVHHKAEIGYWLLPKFWRNGFVKEALPSIIHYGFEKLNLHRIEAYVESENENSARILTSLSFNYEGRLIDCEIKNDRFISLDVYAVVNRT